MKKYVFFVLMIILASKESFAAPSNRGGGINCQNPTTSFNCMACNCYNEAGNQKYEGQVAVGKVVMTRLNMRNYPNTVCGVVKHRYPRTRYYQFSWLNAGNPRRSVPRNHSCMRAANESLKFRGFFADHYYANYVSPKWRKSMRRQGVIGAHIFMASRNMPRTNRYDNNGSTVAALDLLDQLIFNL